MSQKSNKGKVLLLDFWATWCGPCLAELPNLKKAYQAYHDKGFEVVSISLDRDEETLREFIGKEHLNWTHIYNASLRPEASIADLYGVRSIPQMILIGRDGRIIKSGLRGHALTTTVERAIRARGAGSQP